MFPRDRLFDGRYNYFLIKITLSLWELVWNFYFCLRYKKTIKILEDFFTFHLPSHIPDTRPHLGTHKTCNFNMAKIKKKTMNIAFENSIHSEKISATGIMSTTNNNNGLCQQYALYYIKIVIYWHTNDTSFLNILPIWHYIKEIMADMLSTKQHSFVDTTRMTTSISSEARSNQTSILIRGRETHVSP